MDDPRKPKPSKTVIHADRQPTVRPKIRTLLWYRPKTRDVPDGTVRVSQNQQTVATANQSCVSWMLSSQRSVGFLSEPGTAACASLLTTRVPQCPKSRNSKPAEAGSRSGRPPAPFQEPRRPPHQNRNRKQQTLQHFSCDQRCPKSVTKVRTNQQSIPARRPFRTAPPVRPVGEKTYTAITDPCP